jgi:predicted histone-like DNA-binding protein
MIGLRDLVKNGYIEEKDSFNNLKNNFIMSIVYKLWKKKFKDAQNQEQEKYFACKDTPKTWSTKEFANFISEGSTYSESEIIGVLMKTSWGLEHLLDLGHNITLDGIGTFGITVTSNMINSRKELKDIKVRAKRVAFRQSPELSKMLKNTTFTYINEVPSQAFPEKKEQQ